MNDAQVLIHQGHTLGKMILEQGAEGRGGFGFPGSPLGLQGL